MCVCLLWYLCVCVWNLCVCWFKPLSSIHIGWKKTRASFESIEFYRGECIWIWSFSTSKQRIRSKKKVLARSSHQQSRCGISMLGWKRGVKGWER